MICGTHNVPIEIRLLIRYVAILANMSYSISILVYELFHKLIKSFAVHLPLVKPKKRYIPNDRNLNDANVNMFVTQKT